jgi:hypothetical protein
MSLNIQIYGVDKDNIKQQIDVIQTTTKETYAILNESTWQKSRDKYIQILEERFKPDPKDYNMNNPYEKEDYELELEILQDKVKPLFEFDRLIFEMI